MVVAHKQSKIYVYNVDTLENLNSTVSSKSWLGIGTIHMDNLYTLKIDWISRMMSMILSYARECHNLHKYPSDMCGIALDWNRAVQLYQSYIYPRHICKGASLKRRLEIAYVLHLLMILLWTLKTLLARALSNEK